MIKIFCIYNKTLKQFYSPNIQDYDLDSVKRSLYDVVNSDQDNYIKRAPANYAVYLVGEFDPKSGKIVSCKPKCVIELAELKEVVDAS